MFRRAKRASRRPRRPCASRGIDRQQIGALVHGSVCRDFLEPATACGVHHRLGLPNRCAVYDVSNACLGLLNGVVQVANMIELGQIRAGVVVGTESGRALVESTIAHLNADTSLSRQDIKTAFASLTIGSGSAAIVLVRPQAEPHRQPPAGRRHANRHRALRTVPRRPRQSPLSLWERGRG